MPCVPEVLNLGIQKETVHLNGVQRLMLRRFLQDAAFDHTGADAFRTKLARDGQPRCAGAHDHDVEDRQIEFLFRLLQIQVLGHRRSTSIRGC